ncbi:crinkler family protein [Gigaspora margarita]|uniref:Crinkler family protein n=1 Tax=Gigaspora margarita TaxID=4874 RepID=A0A8H3ZXE5_GIGMA|nr:crinkler family protein [Gigaspora margarita]
MSEKSTEPVTSVFSALSNGKIHYFAEFSYNEWDLEHFIKWCIMNFGEINTETNKVFYEILTIISYDSNTSKEVGEIARKLLKRKKFHVLVTETAETFDKIEFDIKNSAHLWENKPSTVLQDITNIPSKRGHGDKTTEICHALLRPFNTVPKNAEDLPLLIKAPLERKLPVAANEEIKFPELQEFIFTCEEERRSDIAIHISGILNDNIKRRFKNSMSEDMMHMPLDLLIMCILECFKEHLGEDLPINLDRNRSDPGSTKRYGRPDFLCWVKDALLLKGEEKADTDQLDIAKSELVSKFNVNDPQKFGDVKFMMGYAAAGPLVQFYAIEGPSKRLIPLSDQLNIKVAKDRINLVSITVNIARVILSIKDIIPNGFSKRKKPKK